MLEAPLPPEEEEEELEPQLAVTVPFVIQTPTSNSPKPLIKTCSSPSVKNHRLKTPLGARRSVPVHGSTGSRPVSRILLENIELDRIPSAAALDVSDAGSRRPSALDILSHHGSEGAIGW